jgi:hypothetical protein
MGTLKTQLLTDRRCRISDFVDSLLQIFARNPEGVGPVFHLARLKHIDFGPVGLNAVREILGRSTSSHKNARALLLRSQVYRALYCACSGYQSGFLSRSAFIQICASYCLTFSNSAFRRWPLGKSWA